MTTRKAYYLFVGSLLLLAAAAPVPPATPLVVEVYPRPAANRGAEPIRGTLVRCGELDLTIKTAKGDVSVLWTDLTASSACTLRSRLINKDKGGDWLELAAFAWGMGAQEQARVAAAKAVALDKDLKAKADALLKSEPGGYFKVPAADSQPARVSGVTASPAAGGGQPGELFGHIKPTGGSPVGPEKIIRFGGSTPAQEAAAVAAARKTWGEMAAKYRLKTVTFETPHFLVLADTAAEQAVLKESLEDAWRAVCQAFGEPAEASAYLGRIPVFVITKPETFVAAALEVDTVALPPEVSAYALASADGSGHLGVCWSMKAGEAADSPARQAWKYMVTREMTHMFLARYRTSRSLPAWLARGLADHVASGGPNASAKEAAAKVAQEHSSLKEVFAAREPEAEYAPALITLVEVLAARDSKALVPLVQAIKDGTAPAAALQTHYHLDTAAFEKAWREYVKEP